MKRSSLLFVFLFPFLSLSVFAQKSVFTNPEAQRDSALAHELLQRAQRQLDSSQAGAAVASAKAAERILLNYAGPNDPLLADAYCLQGIGLVRSDPVRSGTLLQQVSMLPTPADPLSRANVHTFSGLYFLLARQVERAAKEYRKALDLYLAQPGKPHPNTGRAYTNLGYIAYLQSRLRDAHDLYQKAIDLLTTHYGPQYPTLAHAYNNRGLLYWRSGRYKEALEDFHTARRLRLKYLPSHHFELGATFLNMGLIYYEKGALEESHECFFKALDIFQRANDSVYMSLAVNNLGMVRSRQLEYADARRYYEQSHVLEQATTHPDTSEIAVTFYNIGITYRDEREYEKALGYFGQALQMGTPEHKSYAHFLSAAGTAHEGLRQYDEALGYYNRAYEAHAALYDERHPMFASLLFNKANIFKAKGMFEEAMALNRQAQHILGYEGGNNFDKVMMLFQVSILLAQESQLKYLAASQDGDTAGLQQALASAQNALLAYQQFSRINDEPMERKAAKAAAFATAEIAIAAQHRLFKLTGDTAHWREAFQHAERSKSILLLEAMREAKVLKSTNVDTSLLLRERDLKEAITTLDILLQNTLAQSPNPADSAIVRLSLERAALRGQYETLIQSIGRDHPEIGEARFGLRTLSSKYVQDSMLQPGQTLLEFFAGDSSIFIFLVQKDHFEVQEIKKDFPLEQWVDSLTRFGIYAYYSLPKNQRDFPLEPSVKTYTAAAQRLYDKLIAPVEAKLTQELIIIPDGALGYVPFEALLTEAPARPTVFSTYHFLVQEHQVSYCYSATLLLEMRDKRHLHPPVASVLAMAPFFRGDVQKLNPHTNPAHQSPDATRSALETLDASGEEVAAVSKLWNGTPLYGEAASLDTFRRLANQYRILHLSTHGQAHDRAGDYSFLAFAVKDTNEFDQLYARDLYNLNLNADMVVLSACETAIGQLQRGEGMVGLARAFAYAGAKSMVTTLWKVDDKKTRDIMVHFYRYLQAGKTKDAALRQAKLDFLKNNRRDGGAAMHPFFWAGPIAIGDMRPLK